MHWRTNTASLSSALVPSRSIWQVGKDLFFELSTRRRSQLFLLSVLILLGAFAELLSIAALVPFLAVLVDPQPFLQKPWLQYVAHMVDLNNIEQIRWILTFTFCMAALVAGCFRLVLTYVLAKVNFGIAHDLCVKIYIRTLYQPYSVHMARNSSEVLSSIAKVELVSVALYYLLTAISAFVMGLFIVLILILIDPVLASCSIISFAIIYGLISLASNRKLKESSVISNKAQGARIQSMQEGLGGIRDVLLDHAQPVFFKRFISLDTGFRRTQVSLNFIGQSPRFAVEALGMALIAILAFYLTSSGTGGISQAIPILGALALGAQRLMPLAQQVYQGWVQITGNKDVFGDVLYLASQEAPEIDTQNLKPLPFTKDLVLSDVSFQYQPHLPIVLSGISLRIPHGACVGIVGVTGSGKSTLMDLLMGLLLPSTGKILVDGQVLTGSTQLAWQKNIAHVPQDIFLSDTSFTENIAFGVEPDQIDFAQVKKAAERAQIADFIEATPNGYETLVGERGARMSGGQCQRIGIARAFYRRARILVFDEATSALDSETEKSVMSAVKALGTDSTVLMIAHRVSTLRDCDFIIRLDQGRVVFTGSYAELMQQENQEIDHA